MDREVIITEYRIQLSETELLLSSILYSKHTLYRVLQKVSYQSYQLITLNVQGKQPKNFLCSIMAFSITNKTVLLSLSNYVPGFLKLNIPRYPTKRLNNINCRSQY